MCYLCDRYKRCGYPGTASYCLTKTITITP